MHCCILFTNKSSNKLKRILCGFTDPISLCISGSSARMSFRGKSTQLHSSPKTFTHPYGAHLNRLATFDTRM